MKRILYILFSLSFLAACSNNEPTIIEGETAQGVRFYLVKKPEEKRVAIKIAWLSDWAYGEDNNPIAPYIGAQLLLAGGAVGFPAGVAGEKFADWDSQGFINTNSDYAFGELYFEKAYLSETIEIAQAHLHKPLFEEKWRARIEDEFAKKITEVKKQPIAKGFNVARAIVMGDQPLRRYLSLDQQDLLNGVERSDIVRWHEKTIVSDPHSVVITGDLSESEAEQAVDQLLAGLPKRQKSLSKIIEANYEATTIVLHEESAAQSQLIFIAAMPPVHEGHAFADIMLQRALGYGETSVLHKTVREQLRASYFFEAGFAQYNTNNRFLFMTGAVDDAKLEKSVAAIKAAYGEFKRVGTAGQLTELKEPLIDSMKKIKEDYYHLNTTTFENVLTGFKASRVLNLLDELNDVTQADVQKRLEDAFPQFDDFIVIAVSKNPEALPGACVIAHVNEVERCLAPRDKAI
ncbi:M16 family metallopeptidase [Polycladidibacter stylochi]|uniref:M16 family metallopeptidase n=1 Tax=Polycladidibacter stylochi TaxID=1807766 RepID=UPI00082EE1D6|nr:insulinase family protein [Pseudovibrio stylochi]